MIPCLIRGCGFSFAGIWGNFKSQTHGNFCRSCGGFGADRRGKVDQGKKIRRAAAVRIGGGRVVELIGGPMRSGGGSMRRGRVDQGKKIPAGGPELGGIDAAAVMGLIV